VQHAQRIDLSAGVDVELVELRLLGTHVLHGADHLAELGRPNSPLLSLALRSAHRALFFQGSEGDS
jgi:hypothetical protein